MQTLLILGHRAETRKDRESNTIRLRAQHIRVRWTHEAKVRRANYGDVLVGRRMCHGITIRRDISWGRLRGWRRRCDCMGRSFRPLGISADHPLYIREGYRANDWKIICSFPSLVGKMTRDARIYVRASCPFRFPDDSCNSLRLLFLYFCRCRIYTSFTKMKDSWQDTKSEQKNCLCI